MRPPDVGRFHYPYAQPSAPVTHPRIVAFSIWFGAIAVVLLLFICFTIPLVVRPAYNAGTQREYYVAKLFLAMIPFWSALLMATQGFIFALFALIRYPQSRSRTLVGLGFCLAFGAIFLLANHFRLL
jgi:hypothetical protein